MISVTYYYSACVKIFTEDITILCDPWFTEGIYDGSWHHFPKVENPLEKLGNSDYVYISHIHPDHYDPLFLRRYFAKYGLKKILIADWSLNYLSKALQRDNFDFIIVNKKGEFSVKNTKIKIYPQDGKSKSDLDSVLIVQKSSTSGTSCVVNANDTIFDDPTYEAINNLVEKIDILMLSYTGAGPYPQTFYDLNDPILKVEADKKKLDFFKRYQSVVSKLKPKITIPFAGKYLLAGKLSNLNFFRGVSDPVEVLEFDSRALVLNDMGGTATTEGCNSNQLRFVPYATDEYIARLDEIRNVLFPYETQISSEFIEKVNFQKLLVSSFSRANSMSECEFDYFYCLRLSDELFFVMNANKSASKDFRMVKGEVNLPKAHTLLEVDKRYLFGLLLGVFHWDNARIGSHVISRRVGTTYQRQAEVFLNFLHI